MRKVQSISIKYLLHLETNAIGDFGNLWHSHLLHLETNAIGDFGNLWHSHGEKC